MTYEEKKAWLWRYRAAKRFELLRLDELATLETDAMHTTQRYSALPGGGGDGQTLPRAVERIEEARQAAEAQSAGSLPVTVRPLTGWRSKTAPNSSKQHLPSISKTRYH